MLRLVTEFSEHKRKIEDDLSDMTTIIIEHIIKLILMGDNTAFGHWKKEIANFLHKVAKLKGANKFPSYRQLMSWTYDKNEDILTDYAYMKTEVNNIANYYDLSIDYKTNNYVVKNISNFCFDYFDWLAKELSNRGNVDYVEIYNELDVLLNKYYDDVEL